MRGATAFSQAPDATLERLQNAKRIIDGAAANEAHGPLITQKGSAPSVWMIATNEELAIARQTLALARN